MKFIIEVLDRLPEHLADVHRRDGRVPIGNAADKHNVVFILDEAETSAHPFALNIPALSGIPNDAILKITSVTEERESRD